LLAVNFIFFSTYMCHFFLFKNVHFYDSFLLKNILLMIAVINRKKHWSSKHKKKPREEKRNVWRKFRKRSKRDWRGRRFTLVCLFLTVTVYVQIFDWLINKYILAISVDAQFFSFFWHTVQAWSSKLLYSHPGQLSLAIPSSVPGRHNGNQRHAVVIFSITHFRNRIPGCNLPGYPNPVSTFM